MYLVDSFIYSFIHSFQSEGVPSHENMLRLRENDMTANPDEQRRRTSEPFYVNVPSSGLTEQCLLVHDDGPAVSARSRSADNVDNAASHHGSHDSLELIIAEPGTTNAATSSSSGGGSSCSGRSSLRGSDRGRGGSSRRHNCSCCCSSSSLVVVAWWPNG